MLSVMVKAIAAKAIQFAIKRAVSMIGNYLIKNTFKEVADKILDPVEIWAAKKIGKGGIKDEAIGKLAEGVCTAIRDANNIPDNDPPSL